MKHPLIDDPQLTVIAREPFKIYYEGPAQVVTATNKVGEFDVLPGHADFFSMLSAGDVIIGTGTDNPVTFQINNGIITVRDNEVRLFVNM
jgi:F-type H+-transporting ATPase subunit epsilon